MVGMDNRFLPGQKVEVSAHLAMKTDMLKLHCHCHWQPMAAVLLIKDYP